MARFSRQMKRRNAIKAVKDLKRSHRGQKFNSKTQQWEDVQKPYRKDECPLQEYQAKQIEKRLNKIGGKK